MSEFKGTPGKWEVQSPMPDELWIVEAGKQAYEWRVITASPYPDERGDIPRSQVEANARLIAAAPDLLEALQAMTRAFVPFPREDTEGWREEHEAYQDATAAIAKALQS